MSTTTFSGPVKAGTIELSTGTILGTNVANVGQVLMAQTFTTGALSGASGPNETDVVIPANSQIVDIVIDVPVAIVGATAVFSIGDTVGGDSSFINSFSCQAGPTQAGRRYPISQAGGALAWADTGDEDVRLTFSIGGAGPSAGEIRATVLYQQAINLVA